MQAEPKTVTISQIAQAYRKYVTVVSLDNARRILMGMEKSGRFIKPEPKKEYRGTRTRPVYNTEKAREWIEMKRQEKLYRISQISLDKVYFT